ncbi:MAG TPA: hypothetical protein VGJ74_23605 [Burkholderiales bacterium]
MFLLSLLAGVASCSTGTLWNREPQGDEAAIYGYGSSTSNCGIAMEFGVSSNPICKVGVASVDGTNASGDTFVRLPPGMHTVVLRCMVRTSMRASDIRFYTRQVAANFAPAGRYRIKAEWDGSACNQSLWDEASKQEVGVK